MDAGRILCGVWGEKQSGVWVWGENKIALMLMVHPKNPVVKTEH